MKKKIWKKILQWYNSVFYIKLALKYKTYLSTTYLDTRQPESKAENAKKFLQKSAKIWWNHFSHKNQQSTFFYIDYFKWYCLYKLHIFQLLSIVQGAAGRSSYSSVLMQTRPPLSPFWFQAYFYPYCYHTRPENVINKYTILTWKTKFWLFFFFFENLPSIWQ